LNIHTSEFKEHSPDHYFLSVVPYNYDKKAQCPTIIKFLRDVLRHEDIGTIFRLIGYCLLRDCRFQRAVMLYGKGANGKGTLLDLVTAFLGIDNCSHRSLQSIDTNRFAIADLYGKMANTYADLKSMKLSETGNFKMAVAGDWVEGEFKFKNAFKFRNKAKLWFSANEIPESEDKSDAFYRRLLIFHFDKQWLYGKEDVDLFKKLTTPEELSGLLNVALVSLSRLVKEGGFHDQTIEEIRRDYEIHTNDVNAFLYEECIVDITNSDYSTLATDAYAAYVNFCVKRNTRPIDMAPFGKRLADKGIYNQRHKIGGQSDHYYDGMILRRSMLHRDQNTL
jgi:putative DNA primase/helicase